MSSQMAPFEGKSTLKWDKAKSGTESFTVKNSSKLLMSNLLPQYNMDRDTIFESFNRYGWINVFDTEQVTHEFLFFTKPDLNLFTSAPIGDDDTETTITQDQARLVTPLLSIPYFVDTFGRHPQAMFQLQSSVKNSGGSDTTKFMYLLSNLVTSKLDLPSISASNQESTSNLYGTSIQYRSSSMQSDNSYDFSLSFLDTGSLELYHLVKVYDEYMRLLKLGQVAPKRLYIENRIMPEQFSIYKFLIGNDGETILYYAKLTGVYFTDVPRSDFGDPDNAGFKYSLSFHAQFVEDNNPSILSDFNLVSNGSTDTSPANKSFINVYDLNRASVNNDFVYKPIICKYDDDRAIRHKTGVDYRMKWQKSVSYVS